MILLLIISYILQTINNHIVQFRTKGILVELALLSSLIIWSYYISIYESKRFARELYERAKLILKVLEDNRVRPMRMIKVPIFPTLSIVEVYRDGFLHPLPIHLTVMGDIIEFPLGSKSFVDMEFCADYYGLELNKKLVLRKGQTLKAHFFDCIPQIVEEMDTFKFKLLETRLTQTLKDTVIQERPVSVIQNQMKRIKHLFIRRLGIIVFLLSLIVSSLIYFVFDLPRGHNNHWIELLIQVPTYTFLAWVPLSFPNLWFLVRNYCNAYILVLFEALQKNKEEFEDEEDIDEFDTEAPSPVKNVEINMKQVLSKFWSLVTRKDHNFSLTRSTNLFESLGSITTICVIDKEETIATPFPQIEELMFLDDEENTVLLDLSEDSDYYPNGIKFEDSDWQKYMQLLKPLGFNLLLSTRCRTEKTRKYDWEPHLIDPLNQVKCNLCPARQTCLCRLGKEIGFKEDIIDGFSHQKTIVLSAPYHPAIEDPMFKKCKMELPTVTSNLYEEVKSSSYQLFSSGHPELILDLCPDFWDGMSLRPLSGACQAKLHDFYQNAIVKDSQVIAYSYRPINVANRERLTFLNSQDLSVIRLDEASVIPHTPLDTLPSTSTSDQNQSPMIRYLSLNKPSASEEDAEIDPLLAEENPEVFYRSSVKDQVFLALSTMAHQPKNDVCDFIEDLSLAGIRFAYLSPGSEKESKAFAERLGLETDWNTCIRMSSEEEEDFEDHYIKAHLPRGIEQIRDHLENVDDIPLQVSLFAECSPSAVTEMIKIYQEYGEVVCCIGNSLNYVNTPSFAAADLGIAVEPLNRHIATSPASRKRNPQLELHSTLSIGSTLTSLPCGLFFHRDTSFFVLTQIIREARRLMASVRQGGAFLLACGLGISMLYIVSIALLLPPILYGYHIFWLSWLILSFISATFLWNPHEPNTMTSFVSKNVDHVQDFWRFFRYGIFRMIILVSIWIVMFWVSWQNIWEMTSDSGDKHSDSKWHRHGDWSNWNNNHQWAHLHCQNILLMFIVYHLTLVSSTFMSRTLPIWEYNPFQNYIWIISVLLMWLLQSGFTLIFFIFSPFSIEQIFGSLPLHYYLIGFLSPLVFIPFQELIRWFDRRKFTKFQKRSKLEFNTKLGLHSPV
jgi:hypothetical protein